MLLNARFREGDGPCVLDEWSISRDRATFWKVGECEARPVYSDGFGRDTVEAVEKNEPRPHLSIGTSHVCCVGRLESF